MSQKRMAVALSFGDTGAKVDWGHLSLPLQLPGYGLI